MIDLVGVSSTGEDEGDRVVFLLMLTDGVGGVTEVESLFPIVALAIVALVPIVEALVAEVDALEPEVETIEATEIVLLPLPLALPLDTINALPLLATVKKQEEESGGTRNVSEKDNTIDQMEHFVILYDNTQSAFVVLYQCYLDKVTLIIITQQAL